MHHETKLMLEKAGAFGCLPTPVLDVISSANMIVVMEDAVGDSLFFQTRTQACKTSECALNKALGLPDVKGRPEFADRTIHAVQ